MPWTNNDGLVVRFGTEEAKHGNRGGVNPDPTKFVMEVELIGTELSLTQAPLNESILTIPKGLRLEKVEIIVETAFTSAGAATLQIGGLNLNRTALSSAGIVNGQTVASLSAGAVITLTQTSGTAGFWFGSNTAQPALLTANAVTSVFTGGRALVRIHGYMPL